MTDNKFKINILSHNNNKYMFPISVQRFTVINSVFHAHTYFNDQLRPNRDPIIIGKKKKKTLPPCKIIDAFFFNLYIALSFTPNHG